MKKNGPPADTASVYGFDWTEEDRFQRLRARMPEWKVEAPLLEPPYLDPDDMIAACRTEGMEPPRLYLMGFQHNNCGGGCVKAGQAAFAHLYRMISERHAEWEANEQKMRDMLGKPVSILTDRRRDGRKKPLTLAAFRARLEQRKSFDGLDWGSCGCFQVEAD